MQVQLETQSACAGAPLTHPLAEDAAFTVSRWDEWGLCWDGRVAVLPQRAKQSSMLALIGALPLAPSLLRLNALLSSCPLQLLWQWFCGCCHRQGGHAVWWVL